MSDANAASPLPPAPPTRFRPSGCLKFGLIGCGVVVLLVVVLMVVGGVWFSRNSEKFQEGARDGARFGLVRDEAACFDEGKRRAAEASTVTDAFRVGPFVRACLEYSQPTEGFCDDVPPATSIGRTAAWQQQRCGDDGNCRNVLQVVQTYCTGGRPKRTAADTLLMEADDGQPPPATAEADTGSF